MCASSPEGLDAFYGNPQFQQGLDALVSSSTVEQFRRQPAWYGWGDFDAGAGAPRWYVLVRGHLKDPATAQAVHDAGAMMAEPIAQSLGDVAHLPFTGRADDAEFLAIDIWAQPDGIATFYNDPRFQAGAAMAFDGAPEISVFHATDWHQWGSPGRTTLDGRWQITSYTCAGQAQQIGDFQLEVRAGAGTFVQVFDPGACVATYDETYVYSAADAFEITAQSIVCDPSTSCASILGADCLPTPPPTEFTWSLSVDEQLTFTRSAEGPGDLPCQPGDAVEFVMQRLAL
jgi:hypothetical protein